MRTVSLAAAALFLLVSPTAALGAGESVEIVPPDDPVATLDTVVSAAVTTDRDDLTLEFIGRPASGPPCAPTAQEDYSTAGGATDRAFFGDESGRFHQPEQDGTYSSTYTWSQPGAYRLCAWLQRQDEVFAADALDITVRGQRGTISLEIQPTALRYDGSYIAARATGTVEGEVELFGAIVPPSEECPADHRDGRVSMDPPGLSGGFFGGEYSRVMESNDAILFGPMRVCGYLVNGGGYVAATAGELFEPRLKPFTLGKPKVDFRRYAGEKRVLKCQKGQWGAWPKPIRYRYRWSRNGRKLAGKSRSKLATKRNGNYRCTIRAKNDVGARTVRATPYRLD